MDQRADDDDHNGASAMCGMRRARLDLVKAYPAEWPALVAQSHVAYASLHVITGTTAPVRLRIVDGSVTFDRASDTPSEFRATAVDPTGRLTASGARDLLQPFIHEVMITSGAYKPNNPVPISFPLGVFGITRRAIHDSAGRISVELSGKDRSERVQQPLARQYSTAAGVAWDVLIRDLIRLQYPDAMFTNNWPSRDPALAPGRLLAPEVAIDAEGDVWAKCKEGAANIARELDLTADGRFDLCNVPESTAGTPVWRYADGRNAGNVDTDSDLDSDNIYQGVRVKGINGVVGEMWNDNPASLTSRPATGHSRLRTIDANVGSVLVAEARAQAQLTIDLVNAEQISFTARANPALEKRDLLYYKRTPVGINGNYLLNRFELPLGTQGLMNASIGKH